MDCAAHSLALSLPLSCCPIASAAAASQRRRRVGASGRMSHHSARPPVCDVNGSFGPVQQSNNFHNSFLQRRDLAKAQHSVASAATATATAKLSPTATRAFNAPIDLVKFRTTREAFAHCDLTKRGRERVHSPPTHRPNRTPTFFLAASAALIT